MSYLSPRTLCHHLSTRSSVYSLPVSSLLAPFLRDVCDERNQDRERHHFFIPSLGTRGNLTVPEKRLSPGITKSVDRFLPRVNFGYFTLGIITLDFTLEQSGAEETFRLSIDNPR